MNPTFRTDLYRGTARDYDRNRPPYPTALFEDLCRRLPVSGAGRLLDLACGTGQIALPLAVRFAEVCAVDQEPETVAFGRAKAEAAGVTTITWITGAAETIDLQGSFELVAIGTAFHRLNRPVVAERIRTWLTRTGGVALLWSPIPCVGERPWQQAMADLFTDWTSKLGTTDRIPPGWAEAMEREPDEQVLRRAGLDYAGRFEFTTTHVWSVDSLIGYAYSTSLLSRQALGERSAEFEADATERLRACEPDGVFTESATFAYDLARRPP